MERLLSCGSMKEVYQLGLTIAQEGYASDEVLGSLTGVILKGALDERKKAMMLEIISKAEESLLVGATELPVVEVLTSLFYVINLDI